MKFLTRKYLASVVKTDVSSISLSEAIDEPRMCELALLHRVEKADVAQRPQRRREQTGAYVEHGDARVGARKRIALGRFGIESPRGHVAGREIVEQRARYRGLADAALVRSYNDHRWLGHGRSLSAPAPPGAALWSASLIRWMVAARPSESRRFPLQRFYTGRVPFGSA